MLCGGKEPAGATDDDIWVFMGNTVCFFIMLSISQKLQKFAIARRYQPPGT